MFNPGLIDMIMALRSRGISDNAVLRAMELVDRKAFVDAQFRDKAYEDQALPIACGQSIAPPMTTALMAQILGAEPQHKLLEIGLGSGYQTTVLSHIVTRIYAVERYKTLIADAETRFNTLNLINIVTRHGDGRYGWKGQAPFDRIILGCSVSIVPKALKDQLAPNGRLVAVVGDKLMQYDKARTNISEREIVPLSLDRIEKGKSTTL